MGGVGNLRGYSREYSPEYSREYSREPALEIFVVRQCAAPKLILN